jgi:hypothetical protein
MMHHINISCKKTKKYLQIKFQRFIEFCDDFIFILQKKPTYISKIKSNLKFSSFPLIHKHDLKGSNY